MPPETVIPETATPETAVPEEKSAETEETPASETVSTETVTPGVETVEAKESAEPEMQMEALELAESVEKTAEPLEKAEAIVPEAEGAAQDEVAATETENPVTEETDALAAEGAELEETTEPEAAAPQMRMLMAAPLLGASGDALDAPRLTVLPSLVRIGNDFDISIYHVDNATGYNLKIFNKDNARVVNKDNGEIPEGNLLKLTYKAASAIAGLNRVVVTATADGYADGVAETTFRTVVVELNASASAVETGEEYVLPPNVTEGATVTLYEDGTAVSGTHFTKYSAGTHTYRLEAVYDEGTLTAETTVTVSASKGALAQAAVTAPDTVARGEAVSFTVGAVDGANQYIVNVLDADGKAILQDTADTAKQYSIDAELTEGTYRIRVEARGVGYTPSTAEKSFTVTESVKHEVSLKADKAGVAVGESAVLTLTAPDADSAVLYCKPEDGEEQEEKSWTGEIPATYTVTSDTEGSFAYRLAARWGEETVTSETVTVRFVSEALTAPEFTLSEALIAPGDALNVAVTAVENATSYTVSICDASGSEKVKRDLERTENFSIQLPTDALEAGQYNVVVTARAEGYQDAESTVPLRVVKVTLTVDALDVNVGEQYTFTVHADGADVVQLICVGEEIPVHEWKAGETSTPYATAAEKEGEYVYTANAQYGEKWITGNTLTVKVSEAITLVASAATVETGAVYTLSAEGPAADRYTLYENDTAVSGTGTTWERKQFATGEYSYRLEARYGDKVKTATATVTVSASKGKLGEASLTVAETVEQSQDVRLTIGAAANAESYELIMLNQSGTPVISVPNPRAGTFTLPTGGKLPLGAYTLVLTAQAAGYDASVTRKSFTVVTAVDHTMTLTASKTAVNTMEVFTLTITAPGADAVDVEGINQAGQLVFYENWESGGTLTTSVSSAFADTITYSVYGRFGEDWEGGASVEVKVSAAQGSLAQTTLNYPYQVGTGADMNINFTAVPNATSYNLRLINAVTEELAASTVKSQAEAWRVSGLPDGHYLLEVEASAPNYNASLTKGSLHVGTIDQTVAFTVEDSTVETGEDIALNINAPHADQLRLYVKAGSAAEKLVDTFDYTSQYYYSYDSEATLTLRLEALLSGSWVKASAERTVTVTAPEGNLKAPVVDVASQIRKGDMLIFTVTKADNALTQTITIGLKSGTSVSKVYDGAAVGRTFKLDTSKLAEGEYVITATAAAPGYNAASAQTSVYVGTPATPTPTATAKATATAKPTATPKATATKKPSSGGSSSSGSSSSRKATATPKTSPTVVVAVTLTPSPLATITPVPTTAPAMQDNGIMYREAINVQETYGVDTSSDLDAFFMLLDIGEEMNVTAAANGTRYTIEHIGELLNDNERQVFATLQPKDQLFVTASVIGMNQFVNMLDASEFSIETWVLIDDIQMRVNALSAQERQERENQIQRLFGQPATPNGNAVYGIDVTITNGFTTRYERYTFRKDDLWDWLLYKIYIGTAVGDA